MFDRLDANRDGSISRAEFTAAPALREQRHVARSGGKGERGMERSARGMGLRGHMFDMADANRDGRVTMAEATAAAYRHFDMADANRDGQITRDERLQLRQRMRAERRPS
jgi:Ca2+-binding EF-hand superfamily protein